MPLKNRKPRKVPTDKERLDWMQKHKRYPMTWLGTWAMFTEEKTYMFKTVRKAIDCAIAASKRGGK